MKQCISYLLLVCIFFVAACGNKGEQFIGTWQCATNDTRKLEIIQKDKQTYIVKLINESYTNDMGVRELGFSSSQECELTNDRLVGKDGTVELNGSTILYKGQTYHK